MTAPRPLPPPPLVESLTARATLFLERNQRLALAAFTLLYLVGTVLHARSRLFWHDELYTVLLSRLSPGELWRSLEAGVDGHPPLFNLLVKAVWALSPEGEISTRVPAIIGYWVFCLCLFHFVNRRLGAVYGFAALLLPFGTGAYYFATEARTYAVLLGFFGVALVSWQAAAEGRGRWWALPGVAVGLAGVTFSHYYGSFVYAPFAAAEFVRAWQRRGQGKPVFDWPMYGALVAGLLPDLTYLSLAKNLAHYSAHPWNAPRVQDLYLYYKTELASDLVSAVVFMALAALYWSFGEPLAATGKFRAALPAYETTAVVLVAAAPAITLPATFLVTHAFSDRYALTGVAGVVLMAVIVVAFLARGNRVIAAILLASSLLPFLFALTLHQGPLRTPLDTEPLLREAVEQGPVAIDDGPLFLQAWYYLPPELKSRVYYLADPPTAAALSGSDVIDENFVEAVPWMHIPVQQYRNAATPGATILVYHSGTIWSWLPTRLLRDGARMEVLAADRDRNIFRATLPLRPVPVASLGH